MSDEHESTTAGTSANHSTATGAVRLDLTRSLVAEALGTWRSSGEQDARQLSDRALVGGKEFKSENRRSQRRPLIEVQTSEHQLARTHMNGGQSDD